MTDLVCVVADKNMEAAVSALLCRHESLGIRRITVEGPFVHPFHDPGCFFYSHEVLNGYRQTADHALVVFDCAWEGAPATDASELENQLEASLKQVGLGGWARAVAIAPELEAWVFSPSPHVAIALGWQESMDALKIHLEALGLWDQGALKPSDPKEAVECVLEMSKKPRSSAVYREIAGKVGLTKCGDRSFVRFRDLLREWFAA